MHQLTRADRDIYDALAALLTVTPPNHPARRDLINAAATVALTDMQKLPAPVDHLLINTVNGEIWDVIGISQVEHPEGKD